MNHTSSDIDAALHGLLIQNGWELPDGKKLYRRMAQIFCVVCDSEQPHLEIYRHGCPPSEYPRSCRGCANTKYNHNSKPPRPITASWMGRYDNY